MNKLDEVEEAQRRALVQEIRLGPHSYWNAKTNSILARVWAKHRERLTCSKSTFLLDFYEVTAEDLRTEENE